jgi:hypothetical protein
MKLANRTETETIPSGIMGRQKRDGNHSSPKIN